MDENSTQTFGAALTSTVVGDATATVDNLYLGGSNSMTINFDKIRVDDSSIGDNPA